MYDIDFDIRVGIHYGEAVIGTLGSIGHERLTAIGDTVNVASRIEAANKDAGTRLLISETLHSQVKDQVDIADFIRVRLRGTDERITLYDVNGLKPEARAQLDSGTSHETTLYGGKKWTLALNESELEIGERRILPFGDLDVVVLRLSDGFHAFNNACPHMHLPLFETRDLAEGDIGCFPNTDTPRPLASTITQDRGLVCRWHHSCFDLQTGEIRDWATRLQDDGTSAGWEFLGDMSRNRRTLKVYACRVYDGQLWLCLK